MTPRRFFTAAGVVAVAGVAGAISYQHQEHLATTHGQGSMGHAWPLCVDGLIVVTSIAISTDRAAGYRARVWALAGFWIGVLVSVTTNWLATTGGIINHAISAFPALAFLLAIESLSGKPRPLKVPRAQVATSPATETAATPKPAAAPKPRAKKAAPAVAKAAVIAQQRPELRPGQIADLAGVSRTSARRAIERIPQLQEAS